VSLSGKAELTIETRQVFRRAGTRHSSWAFFSKDSCSQTKSAYKAVAGVNDPGYIPRTLTLQY